MSKQPIYSTFNWENRSPMLDKRNTLMAKLSVISLCWVKSAKIHKIFIFIHLLEHSRVLKDIYSYILYNYYVIRIPKTFNIYEPYSFSIKFELKVDSFSQVCIFCYKIRWLPDKTSQPLIVRVHIFHLSLFQMIKSRYMYFWHIQWLNNFLLFRDTSLMIG
jgi:hypothetical protein